MSILTLYINPTYNWVNCAKRPNCARRVRLDGVITAALTLTLEAGRDLDLWVVTKSEGGHTVSWFYKQTCRQLVHPEKSGLVINVGET